MNGFLIKIVRIVVFLLPLSLFSQSEGGFGFRRFANTTTLNNVSVSNSDKSASRSAYVHSNGLYYVWDGNSWEREHDIDTLSFTNPNLSISLYGDGVPAKTLNISGVLESLTADNGLTKSTNSNVQLGGTLIKSTTITGGAFTLTNTGSSASTQLQVTNTSSGNALGINANSGAGVSSFSTSGIGGSFVSTSNFGIQAQTSSGSAAANIITNPSSTNTVQSIMRVQRQSSGTPANGLGGAINFYLENTSGTSEAGAISYQLTDATNATRTSLFELTTMNSSTLSRKFAVAGNGQITMDTYGDGTFTGTPTYYAGWDANGNLVEVSGTSGSGDNIYNTNDTTTSFLRTAFVLRSLWFRGIDSVGFIRWGIRPDNFDGTQVTVYQDSLVNDADTIVWESSWNPSFQFHQFRSTNTHFYVDSAKVFGIGDFPGFPVLNYDGRDKGFFYDPQSEGVLMINGDGVNLSKTRMLLNPYSADILTEYPTSSSRLAFSGLSENASQSGSVNRTSSTYGSIYSVLITNTNEEIAAITQNGKITKPSVSMYLGDGYSSSQHAQYADRAWGVQTHLAGQGFDWLQVLLPDTATDTTGNNINFYNRKYYFPNQAPSSTLGDSSVLVWVGDGTTGGKNPVWRSYSSGGSGANIYNANGTTTDNTRSVTILESLRFSGSADVGQQYPFQISSTGNEPRIQLWKGNTDSAYVYQSDVEYVIGSSARLIVQSDDDLYLQADSVGIQTVESKTKIRGILGITPSGITKQFDGDAASNGDILMSNGTDWLVTSASSFASTLGAFVNNGNSFAASAVLGTNDNNSLSFEVNNVTGLTLGTDYSLTATASVASTNSTSDRLVIRTNSTGTPSSSFGGGILLQGESSTTDNRDMARIIADWTTATDATRTSRLKFNTISNGSEVVAVTFTNGDQMNIGGAGANYFSTSILTSSSFTLSSSSTSSSGLTIQGSGNNTAASVTMGGGSFSTTSGQKNDFRFTSSYSPTSGTGKFYAVQFLNTLNQTGVTNGATGAIIFEPILTSIGSKWSALTSATSNANALFINQTGASSYSTHVGAFGFGATTVPTDKLEVTGNIALLTAGNKLKIATGSGASVGTSTLVGGTVTVSTTAVTASSKIFYNVATAGGTQGYLSLGTITAGTSFVINSTSATETSTINWWIIN